MKQSTINNKLSEAYKKYDARKRKWVQVYVLRRYINGYWEDLKEKNTWNEICKYRSKEYQDCRIDIVLKKQKVFV